MIRAKVKTAKNATYVIIEVERVVGAVGEDLVVVVELCEDSLRLLAQQVALDTAVLDLLQLQEVLHRREQRLNQKTRDTQ